MTMATKSRSSAEIKLHSGNTITTGTQIIVQLLNGRYERAMVQAVTPEAYFPILVNYGKRVQVSTRHKSKPLMQSSWQWILPEEVVEVIA